MNAAQGGRKPPLRLLPAFQRRRRRTSRAPSSLPEAPRTHYGKGIAFFHVDCSFSPRRASYSPLKASNLPPAGTGGNTEFADTRTAFETLPVELKNRFVDEELGGVHSLHHSRKRGGPEYFAHLKPEDYHMHRHRIAQVHEPSGRWNLIWARIWRGLSRRGKWRAGI